MLLLCGTLTREPFLPNTVRWPASHHVTRWSKQRNGSASALLNICKARRCFGHSELTMYHPWRSVLSSRLCVEDVILTVTVSPSWSYFCNSSGAPILSQGLVQKGNRGWVNQRTGSPHWKKKRLRGTHASMCTFSSWARAGHPNRIVFQLARKGPWPDARKVFVSAQALQEGICICNMGMSFFFSYTGWTGN